jgi:transcriptional regulator with XRE-family HTH domain
MSGKQAVGFGPWVRKRRAELRLSLRKLAEETKLDPGNLSRYERGLLAAPQDEAILKRLANGLKLKQGTNEYQAFFDVAAASAGRLPRDLQEPDIVKRMPLLFRAARRREFSREELKKLAEELKNL